MSSELAATLQISEPDELVNPGPFSVFVVGRGLSSSDVLVLIAESEPIQFQGQAPALYVAVKPRYSGGAFRPGRTTTVTGAVLNPAVDQGQMFIGDLSLSESAPLDLYLAGLR